jgi:hypothetical protein
MRENRLAGPRDLAGLGFSMTIVGALNCQLAIGPFGR